MTPRRRPVKPNQTLRQVAKSRSGGRGFAASKGEWLPRAQAVGASRPEFFTMTTRTGLSFDERCCVTSCRNPHEEGGKWCTFHVAAAARLHR